MSLLKVGVLILFLGLTTPGWGQKFQSLHSFPADGLDGKEPYATLTLGPDGALYGTTVEGGGHDGGTAFKVNVDGEVTILGDFEPLTTGRYPYARLVNIGDGYLYGATERNRNIAGDPDGTVYRLDPNGGLSVVFQIPSGVGNPSNPMSLTSGEPNTLHVLGNDYPGLWRVPLDGTPAHVAYLFDAGEKDGHFAWSLIRGRDGKLYGTTQGNTRSGSGTNARGTIFRIAPNGTGMTNLHECQVETGTTPYGAMVQGPDGNFYGTMGESGKEWDGCIFRLTPAGEYKVLYHFGSRTNDLKYPRGDLMIATDGRIYGTTSEGGRDGYGGVFRIKTNGSGYEVLHTFNGDNGRNPWGGLVQAADGNLYGTTRYGGKGGNGTIYRIKVNLPAPPVNRPPVAINDVGVSTGDEVVIPVRANDYDPDGDGLTVEIQNPPTAGTATVRDDGAILYTPGGSYAGSDQFTYTISDGRGGVASATVSITSTEPEPPLAGTYQGLLMWDPELSHEGDLPRGQFSLKVKSSGRFTGVLLTQRKRVSLRGSFTADGTATVKLKLPNKRAATLFLSVQPGTPATIRGILYGSEFWSGEAGPAQPSGDSETKRYTVLLDPNPALADGHGYGVMTIKRNGSVSVVGKLGDGSKLSWSSSLISLPESPTALPVFSEPLAGGVIGGKLLEKNAPVGSFAGALRWIRPPASKPTKPYALGFDGLVNASAGRYFGTTPRPGQRIAGRVTLSDGSSTEPLPGEFLMNGKKVSAEAPLRSLSFNFKTGLFSGKMKVKKKTVTFQGVLDLMQENGRGQFSVGGVTGSVLLEVFPISEFD